MKDQIGHFSGPKNCPKYDGQDEYFKDVAKEISENDIVINLRKLHCNLNKINCTLGGRT